MTLVFVLASFIRAYAEAHEISFLKALQFLADQDAFEDRVETFILRRTFQHGVEMVGEPPRGMVMELRREKEEVIE